MTLLVWVVREPGSGRALDEAPSCLEAMARARAELRARVDLEILAVECHTFDAAERGDWSFPRVHRTVRRADVGGAP